MTDPSRVVILGSHCSHPAQGRRRVLWRKQGGGIAGHNGLRDISQRIGSHDYWRLRLGVGKPPAGAEGADYVLQKPPAEERASTGAVVLENSPVPAQRKAYAESAARTGVTSVGRGLVRATTRAEVLGELASAREAEAAEFHRRGAGALTEK